MRLLQDFESELQQLKTELIADLEKSNVWWPGVLGQLQLEYNDKIVDVQDKFLDKLSSTYPKVAIKALKPTGVFFWLIPGWAKNLMVEDYEKVIAPTLRE